MKKTNWTPILFIIAGLSTTILIIEEIAEHNTHIWIIEWAVNHVFITVINLILIVCIILGWIIVKKMNRHQSKLEDKVALASDAFREMLEQYFEEWNLSASEIEIFHLLLKGCTIAEISEIRGTAVGTIKSQTNAIYKKSGYSNKTQLLSALIEDLTDGRSAF